MSDTRTATPIVSRDTPNSFRGPPASSEREAHISVVVDGDAGQTHEQVSSGRGGVFARPVVVFAAPAGRLGLGNVHARVVLHELLEHVGGSVLGPDRQEAKNIGYAPGVSSTVAKLGTCDATKTLLMVREATVTFAKTLKNERPSPRTDPRVRLLGTGANEKKKKKAPTLEI